MNWRKFLTALLVVGIFLSAALVGATVKLYTATGEGYAWEDEQQDIAKLRARDKAIKKATKQASVVLKTYSRSIDSELTDDEITAITSNAWQLVGEPKYTKEIINHSGDTQIIVWKATVEVNVDDAEITKWVKRDDKEKSTIITQTREAQKSSEENDRKVEDLREKYKRATSQAEKDNLRKQMSDADRDFLANQKFEEALKFYYAKDYHGAIKLNTEAIELKPDWSWPYNNRGATYDNLGHNTSVRFPITTRRFNSIRTMQRLINFAEFVIKNSATTQKLKLTSTKPSSSAGKADDELKFFPVKSGGDFFYGKKIFSVASSDFLPKYEPIKNKISEHVIPIVIWCKLKILKPAACVAQ